MLKPCNKPGDVPAGDHWAIIEFTTYSDGCYPDGETRSMQLYTAFTDEASWMEAVEEMTVSNRRPHFVAIRAKRATITTKVTVL
jgi:hypothetical protein